MDAQVKTELLRRLKSIGGHIRGVEKMVADDAYCIDVINQVQAVQAALGKLNVLLLNDHLRRCVTTAVRSEDADDRERVLSEIADVYAAATKL